MARQKIRNTFHAVSRGQVPSGRNGKHKKIVTAILADLQQLKDGSALKIPIEDLGDTKENVRSALNRATRKIGHTVSTAADDKFFYVWNAEQQ